MSLQEKVLNIVNDIKNQEWLHAGCEKTILRLAISTIHFHALTSSCKDEENMLLNHAENLINNI